MAVHSAGPWDPLKLLLLLLLLLYYCLLYAG